MKEHSLFLMAGFPGKNADYIEKADWYRNQFEELLKEVVELSQGRVSDEMLNSGETVTEFTLLEEHKTCNLTGIEIDTSITERQLEMVSECEGSHNKDGINYRRDDRGNHRRDDRRTTWRDDNSNREWRNREGCSREGCNGARRNREWQNRNTISNQERNIIGKINRRALQLVEGLIDFKEDILKNVSEGCLFTTNYPLLADHVLREANHYLRLLEQ
ncbi:MAG: DUF2935 domain-containing protein [Lachnospiraceae bacterium]|nr:DUF2935 domain-containing protein [Lachnospiraceae bacterium]